MTRLLVLVLALLATPWAFAQSYPVKPVRVIVTFPPGGTPDIYGRIMAAELGRIWNQPVVVENRTGAAGTIGTDFVAKAPPDGYTLLFAADATLTLASWLYTKLPYDPLKDFTPIVNVAAGPFVLLAHPSFKASNVREFIELAKAQPGKIPYASSGAGTQQHLSMETVRAITGIDVLHVPYKGFGQGFADVLANQVPLIFGGITASISHIKSGKVKGLGVTSPQRAKALPEVPSFAESGLPGFDIQAWYGFVGPAGMPREVVRRIHADAVAVVQRPDFLDRLAKDGIEPVGNTPEAFAAQIKSDVERWRPIVKAAGVKPE
jgi:tripartite-type tricarboxylate transporter receptor subunit TctC